MALPHSAHRGDEIGTAEAQDPIITGYGYGSGLLDFCLLFFCFQSPHCPCTLSPVEQSNELKEISEAVRNTEIEDSPSYMNVLMWTEQLSALHWAGVRSVFWYLGGAFLTPMLPGTLPSSSPLWCRS